MSDHDEGRCTGPSCGALIWWIKVGEKKIPVDPKPRSMIVLRDDGWGRVQAWTPHHATCPDVEKFRNWKKGAAHEKETPGSGGAAGSGPGAGRGDGRVPDYR